MPKAKTEAPATDAPKTLYTVLINGVDHTVYATDYEDLQRQIARLKA